MWLFEGICHWENPAQTGLSSLTQRQEVCSGQDWPWRFLSLSYSPLLKYTRRNSGWLSWILACNSASKLVTDMELGGERKDRVRTGAEVGTTARNSRGMGPGLEQENGVLHRAAQ
jgi:hypothetical protein